MSEEIKLTEEQKKELVDYLQDQKTKLGEVFSQCWESDEFRDAFKEDPKAILKEYGVKYDDSKTYKVIDTPEKTVIHVLPYEGIKGGLLDMYQRLGKNVEGLDDNEGKQIIPNGWSYQLIQNTEDTVYMPIPLSPENLSPEELEMVNGGCLILVIVVATVAIAEAVLEATSMVTTVAGITQLVAVALAVFMGVSIEAVAVLTTAITVAEVATATIGVTGSIVFNGTAGWDFDGDKNK